MRDYTRVPHRRHGFHGGMALSTKIDHPVAFRRGGLMHKGLKTAFASPYL
jgi:hypothetical protein